MIPVGLLCTVKLKGGRSYDICSLFVWDIRENRTKAALDALCSQSHSHGGLLQWEKALIDI